MRIIEDFIPESNSNRPGTSLTPTFITVHETDNTDVGANAEMHSIYVKGSDAQEREVSWHFTVDDTEIYQHLPIDELGWHSGREGNHSSLGIELCVNSDGDFNATRANAIELIFMLMEELNFTTENVTTHNYWTNKNCPRNLLSNWNEFINDLGGSPEVKGRLLEVIAFELWVYDEPDWEAKYITVMQGEVFTIDSALTVNGSLMYQLKSGLYITGNTEYVRLLN